MKKLVLILAIFVVACTSRPFEPTNTVYDSRFLKQENSTTHVRVHRISQLTGSGLGESCPLVLKVDHVETVGLQQNQYVDLFLPSGEHVLSIRFKCALTAWKKSLELIADGGYQEYTAENGPAGEYRMWRAK